jgi:sortase A
MRNFLTPSPRKTLTKRTRTLLIACRALFVFGVLALAYAGFLFADALCYQAQQIHLLEQTDPPAEASLSPQPGLPAEADLPEQPPAVAEGDVLGEILVPRLDLQAVVVQGDSPDDLELAVGHLSNSALPGEQGNVALAAHRDTFFRPLRNIRVGDEIKFKTRQRSFDYVVESTEVVAPTDVTVLQPSPGHDLTLLTCYPFHYIGPAPKRFVVFAREIAATRNSQPN